jgi:hypothetical protein
MHDYAIGMSDHLERRAFVSRLSARFLARLLPGRIRAAPDAVTGGRLAAVLAVLSSLGLDGLDPLV